MIEAPLTLTISGIAACMPRNTPVRLMSSVLRQMSSGNSVIGAPVAMPALLTSTWRPPNVATAWVTAAFQSSGWVTSRWM